MCKVYYIAEAFEGSCFMVVGEKAIVFDPGMAYYADKTIAKIHEILGDKEVDAIFLTHSHYDHTGAVPYYRQEWPNAKVYASSYAAKIFSKPTARKIMYDLTLSAAKGAGFDWTGPYDEDLLTVDEIVEYDEIVKIGDLNIQVLSAVGHTKCSVSFIVNDEIMIASETIGMLGVKGEYIPEFLVDYASTLACILKSRQYHLKWITLAHKGMVENPDEVFWDVFEDGIRESQEVIINILKTYPEHEAQMKAMADVYWGRASKATWPYDAFAMNAEAMLKTIAREFADEIAGE